MMYDIVTVPISQQSTHLIPYLVKMASRIDILAFEAGTRLPIWAIRAQMAADRRYVLLPPILAPVRMTIRSEPAKHNKSNKVQLFIKSHLISEITY